MEKKDDHENLLNVVKLLESKEKEYLNSKGYIKEKFYDKKVNEINAIVQYLECKESDEKLSSYDFEILKSLAISKGGFISNKFRRFLWKKLLFVGKVDSQNLHFIKVSGKANEIKFYKEDLDYQLDKEYEYCKIVEADVKRSVVNQLLEKEFESSKLIIKQEELKFINLFFKTNNQEYKYFQGFHDIGLYFLLLNFLTPNIALTSFQHFSELHFKDLLEGKDYTESKTIFNIIPSLVGELVALIQPKLAKSLNIEESKPFYTLPWIITYFTHNIKSIFLQFRVFDYLILSHPAAVYFLTAQIIIIQGMKLLKENGVDELEEMLIFSFQKINFEEFDFDYLITQNEVLMKQHLSKFLKKANSLGMNTTSNTMLSNTLEMYFTGKKPNKNSYFIHLFLGSVIIVALALLIKTYKNK